MPRDTSPHFQLFARGSYAPVRWRLLSGNNRDLGRSVAEFPDAESCLLDLKQACRDLHELTAQVVPLGNRWSWRLSLDGAEVAVASHTFDRRTRCEAACAAFRATAYGARVPAAAVRASRRPR